MLPEVMAWILHPDFQRHLQHVSVCDQVQGFDHSLHNLEDIKSDFVQINKSHFNPK
jgi:hypothetical protein